LASWLVGKRVACGLQGDRHGTWAEYFIAKARECVPLKRGITFDQAAGLIINPFTAVGLLETAKRGGHRAAVHTAGASQVGRMLQVLATEMNYPLIQVVRREEQVELLKSLGAGGKPSQRGGQTHFSPAASEKSGQTPTVLNSSRESFAEELRAVCERLGATVAFEAVAGAMTGTVLNALPPRSVVYVYGGLSEEPCENIDPIELIFHNKEVKGFYLGSWMRRRGAWGAFRAAGRVQRLISDGRIATVVQRRVSLDEAKEGLRQYVESMTAGKVLIMPHGHGGGSN
jgi:NADPH:quinone reductase-like Zn-dependent oxidoreductase